MEPIAHRATAIVGLAAVLPEAPNVAAFWRNVKSGRCSITEVTPDRWDPAFYYDPDPSVPDKTYSKIGAWVREHTWDPIAWHLPIPPRVAAAMDDGQKWAIACTREALADFGYPERSLDPTRTAVILGNAMAGERHYLTSVRAHFPEFAHELAAAASFAGLPSSRRTEIIREFHSRIGNRFPEITEDTMPGELANCIAGRIANVFNFRGPNYVVDAACASSMAAISSAAEGLIEHDFDVAITGGVDRNMGASSFIKFSKIGALSASGSRPYAKGADGFVMGEGCVIFVLKRLADAEKDGDKIYAVVRGIGASSDGKGKGITAPNPAGQLLAIRRAWEHAGISPGTATLIEGHGTSTRVGDVVEAESLAEVLRPCDLPFGCVALGSVKSNIGHLKAAAGAAGVLKVALSLQERILPPSANCEHPNPDIDFAHSPLFVNTEVRPWEMHAEGMRRAGVSAFGFGGTNFHVVLEEYIPHRITANGKLSISVGEVPKTPEGPSPHKFSRVFHKTPLRGAIVIGAASESVLADRLRSVHESAQAGRAPEPMAPLESDLRAQERIAIDFEDAADLAEKSAKALKAIAANLPAMWRALRSQGVFRGSGPAPKVAFLYTGQGSQYVNMLQSLRASEPIVAGTFAEADAVMTPLLGKPLSDFIFVDGTDPNATAKAEEDLRQTAITQPAVLAADLALTRLLAAYGIEPDMTMGHSLGEYGALVASGGFPFADALEAVSARGREMTRVSMEDNGRMAAVFAPIAEIEKILKTIDGYVVVANINSNTQAVIGGATKAVEQAVTAFQTAGYNAVPLPVSHAFHSSIVAPASEPFRRVLQRLHLQSPRIPIVANLDGEFYPTGPDVVPHMLDTLARQIASPVQFVKGLRTLYQAGARVFVEVGPKKALQVFAEDVLGEGGDVVSLFTNHPKIGDTAAFNQALCGLYAAGLGNGRPEAAIDAADAPAKSLPMAPQPLLALTPPPARIERGPASPMTKNRYMELGRLFADVLERGSQIYHGGGSNGTSKPTPVVITGAALGLPGTEHIFDDSNIGRILRGEQFIDVIPTRFRRAMLDKHITRLVKTGAGGPSFEAIDDVADVIKLAARGGLFDLQKEFDVSGDRVAALDRVTQLAIAVGIDALRDAGIPLVLRYKTTSKNTQLPDRWGLPDALRDDTGVIFASVFPGFNSFADYMSRYYADHSRREQLEMLENLRSVVASTNGNSSPLQDLQRRISELRLAIEQDPFVFDRRFLFRVLSMGHSQFAELIGARGPNTQVNAACASTTHAVSIAEDWIHAGRCRRVVIVSADDVSSDNLIEWFGAGFLASGAAATDDVVENVALPFDRRRHGMVIGMGAAALVLESAEAARERGLRPLCEVLSAVTANSAFHGTRLDVEHISGVMEDVVAKAEASGGVRREQFAQNTVFVSHETYTPARGGSASAEVFALRRVFGAAADSIVVTNTKGFTGHPMGAGIEDVVAVKALETGCVPPVANFKEVDPELGPLNLSKGAMYPVEYALRLGAGFGSQISMTLVRRVADGNAVRPSPNALGYAYRINDQNAWSNWVSRIAGQKHVNLEVVHRTLRVRADGAPTRGSGAAQDARLTAAASPPAPLPSTQPSVVEHASTNGRGQAAPDVVPASDPVKDRILALVAEKTGYPIDMLDLDLDLEADLGVDTVKQAEVFASVREAYGLAREDKLRLRDYPTLTHVIRFVHERRPDLAQETKPLPALKTETLGDAVKDRILELVVEKTGYPRDMLDLDLDLEADLGIDTVKQAEMMAAIRATYDIPRDEHLKLRDFPTLAHVIQFVYSKRPDLAGTPQAVVVTKPEVAADDAIDAIKEKVLEIAAEKTGYPNDMLDLDLDLEADLGIDTVKQAEMFASVRAAFNIGRDQNLKLRDFPTLSHVIQFARTRAAAANQPLSPPAPVELARTIAAPLDDSNRIRGRVPVPTLRPPVTMCKTTGVTLGPGSRVVVMPDQGGVAEALNETLRGMGVEVLSVKRTTPADVLIQQVSNWMSEGSVQGVFWLPALDDEGRMRDMDLVAWREALRIRVKSLYATMRVLYEQVALSGTFLVTATRLGGQHGYDEPGATSPMGGAVTGFAKTYKRERTQAHVKAVDFEAGSPAAQVAGVLIEEVLRDPGALEIGHKAGLRWTIRLQDESAPGNLEPGLTLDKDSVFVITGAAGGIVSAITSDLAAASGGTFYLLDVAPEPDAHNPDLKRFVDDKDGLKRDIAARMRERGERATPALVETQLAAIERMLAAQNAIDAVRAAGGTAYYFRADIRDADEVMRAINAVRERSGRIDVLLHAAGLDRSHMLPDKDPREFDLVFDVKADGWFNLLRSIADMPLRAVVAFTSIAGRFGNAGQTDYSSANDLLCKMTTNLRTTMPRTRAIAIDWTAWASIGMASRGSIPKMMELAGIDMLPPEGAVPVIRRELTTGVTRGEVIIAQKLGVLLDELDDTGGLDSTALNLSGPMFGRVTAFGIHHGLTVETMLDPTVQPFLHDHRIDGTPVLPGVMSVEAFAEAAQSIVPGWHIDRIENVDFVAPFKFYRDEPRSVIIEVRFRLEDDRLVANCQLLGHRLVANQVEPQITLHSNATVRLTKAEHHEADAAPPDPPDGIPIESSNIYRVFFHGPAYQVVDRAWIDSHHTVGRFATDLPPNHLPTELRLTFAPRLVELCFQTAGLRELATHNRLGLPTHIDEVHLFGDPDHAEGPLFAFVTLTADADRFNAEVLDSAGRRYLALRGYRTVSLADPVDTEPLKALHAVVG
jgi:acyl transferase domain-containing protein/NAD(P)-dependent dehydrogenase (short-subunit alcohol dehydrogenase family)/acyl carrier protein